MGFSRDRQVVHDLKASNTNEENSSHKMSFFAAPTISYNSSGIGFIATETGWCEETAEMYKFKVDTDVSASNGKCFNDVSSQFVHIALTVEPSSNTMTYYVDGYPLISSGIQTSFGTQKSHSFLATPTPYKTSRFSDDGYENKHDASFFYSYLSTSGLQDFSVGPQLDTIYTPWILGGGYTDGYLKWLGEASAQTQLPDLPGAGGFMNKYHGKTSGLNGFVGSVKFYAKALSNKEVLRNFNAQRNYFKNIEV